MDVVRYSGPLIPRSSAESASIEDFERLIKSSGETVDIEYGRKSDPKPDGTVRYSYSESERVVPRITMNDVLLTSDHPFRSFVQITRGEGYAQYGGFPVIIESNYHISEAEYRRRRAMPWPSLPGMLPPGSRTPTPAPKPETSVASGPAVTQEVIGTGDDPNASPDAIDKFFKGLNEAFEPPTPRRRKGKQS